MKNILHKRRWSKSSLMIATITFSSSLLLTGCNDDDPIVVVEEPPAAVTVSWPNQVQYTTQGQPLMAESIAYHSAADTLLLSSSTAGVISQVDAEGNFTSLIAPETFAGNGTFGLAIDENNQRLLAVSANFQNPLTGSLFIFDLINYELLHQVDLAVLTPGLSFVNDVTVDDNGNAYVTNSDQGVIYQVTLDGEASIYFEDQAFTPNDPATETGFNGIDYHSDGYLLVSHYESNTIYKLLLDGSSTITEVVLPEGYVSGGDGIKVSDNTLAVVNNAAVPFVSMFTTDDNWATGTLVGDTYATGDVFPTAVAKIGDDYLVSNAYLNFPVYGDLPSNYLITKAYFDRSIRFSGSSTEIPRINTPVMPMGYGTDYPEPFYANCTDDIAPGVPDIRGDWVETTVTINGEVFAANSDLHEERIEQCGERVLIVANTVLHEIVVADGSMFNGVNDINPLGQPIHSTAMFNNSTLILTPVLPVAADITVPDVTRELLVDDDGNEVLRFFNLQLGSVRYLTKS